MAKKAVGKHGISIRLSCEVYGISETCYRYNSKLGDENGRVADWLLRLTQAHKRWGFGLCFLHLRNVKGFGWNHKRVYRIYRELELNLRIKPRRRITRAYPGELDVPKAANQVWSMDFMSDGLSDGRKIRTFNVIDDNNHEARGDSENWFVIYPAGQAHAECVHRTVQPQDTARMVGSAPLRFTRSSAPVSDPMDLGIQ